MKTQILVGQRLRKLRLAKDESQEDAAAAVTAIAISLLPDLKKNGIGRSFFSKLENNKGNSDPSVPVLVAMAMYYEVSTEFLLGRSDTEVLGKKGDLPESEHERASVAELRDLAEKNNRLLQDLVAVARKLPARPPSSRRATRKRHNDPA